MFKRFIDVLTLGSEHPMRRLLAYYAVLAAVLVIMLTVFPGTSEFMAGRSATTAGATPQLLQDGLNAPPLVQIALGPGSIGELMITTSLVLLGIVMLMLPVTWVYMSARNVPGHSQAVVQTLIILPIVVAGIVLVVQNSLALAFSLAGVVAAVRFRTTLRDARDVVYIFLAIAVGFAAGVQMLALAVVISIAFNFVVLITWRYDFGRSVLAPTAASQWSEPLNSLAKTNGHRVPDRDLVLALTPKKVDALAQRFERVRAVLGSSKKKPQYDAVLTITSDKVGAAQLVVEKVLDKLVKRWVLDEVVTNVGKPSEVYYLLRLTKSTTRDDLITAVRARAGQQIAAVDLEVGDALAREEQESS